MTIQNYSTVAPRNTTKSASRPTKRRRVKKKDRSKKRRKGLLEPNRGYPQIR